MMKQILVGLAATLALVLLPWMTPHIVRADPSNGAYNFAVGGGTDSSGEHFAFSAHCQVARPMECDQNSPTAPTGHVTYTKVQVSGGGSTFVTLRGPVTCLLVVANKAYITWLNTSSNPFPGNPYITISTQDNGPPVNGQPVDRISYTELATANQNECSNLGTDALLDSNEPLIASGNIVVNQGSILPCTPLTDNTTFMVDSSCNLYTNTGTATNPTWTLVQ